MGWFFNWFKPKPKPVPTPSPGEKSLMELHNDFRFDNNRSQLTLNEKLTTAAQGWANWMAANRRMTHQAGVSTVFSRVNSTGYRTWSVGENIAMGHRTNEAVFDAWVKSPGHLQNILNANFKDFGSGKSPDANGQLYWCTVFASTEGKVLGFVHTPEGVYQ